MIDRMEQYMGNNHTGPCHGHGACGDGENDDDEEEVLPDGDQFHKIITISMIDVMTDRTNEGGARVEAAQILLALNVVTRHR